MSAGDVYRKRLADGIAEARVEEQAKAQKLVAEKVAEERQKAETNLAQNRADTEAVLRDMGISDEQIAEMQAKLYALRQSRLSQK